MRPEQAKALKGGGGGNIGALPSGTLREGLAFSERVGVALLDKCGYWLILSYSPNSSKGGCMGDYIGLYRDIWLILCVSQR